jgi:hypothetical protein
MAFWKQLLYSVLCSLLGYSLLNAVLDTSEYWDLFLIGLGFFSLLAWIIHLFMKRPSTNKNRILYLIVANMFLKIICSFVIIYAYVLINQPDNKLFVLPFLVTYLVYLGFEGYSSSKAAESA